MDQDRPAQASSALSPQHDAREQRFGSLVLHLTQGRGRLTLPAEISLPVLRDLQTALLAGRECPDGVVLDCSEVARCDVFFYQLLLAARRSFAKRSKSLTSTGPLPEDLRKACLAQGFGVEGGEDLLPRATQP